MSYTTAQSGDNYRNWWPSELMTEFTNHSIDLMHDIARRSSNVLQMKQGGYALATRRREIDDLLAALEQNYGQSEGLIREHNKATAVRYQSPDCKDWNSDIDGVDILSNKSLIKEVFPGFSTEIEHVLHVRKAGDFSSQQLGQYMLQEVAPLGLKRLRGMVRGIARNDGYDLEIDAGNGMKKLSADVVVNAAGPYIGEIAKMLGIELPIKNIFHQKLAFEDHLSAIPRQQPFSIDIDQTTLSWTEEERAALAEDAELSWLTKPIDGGIHCRPEGQGRWIKLGWAYNRQASIPNNSKALNEDPMFDANFPELVLRGASNLNPSLKPYIEALPIKRVHYGGYYTMTEENWPLVGPLDQSGAFMVGALSGFGAMSACAAGSLCADWICGGDLPSFAQTLSLQRYENTALVAQMEQQKDVGLL